MTICFKGIEMFIMKEKKRTLDLCHPLDLFISTITLRQFSCTEEQTGNI